MSDDEAKSLVEEAEIGGPLENWKANGKTVTYLGTEDVEGTAAHKLKVVRKNGDMSYVYLDPDHFLEIRVIDQRMEQGAKVEVETDLGDYEKVNGVYFPFSIEAGRKGSSDKQKTIIEKAEANIPVDDSDVRFSRPKLQNNFTIIHAHSQIFLFSLALALPALRSAREAPYSSATISGLGARNIGSATMSGRVAAIAAQPRSHRAKSRSSSARPAAASGNPRTAALIIKPVFDEQPVQSIGAIALDPKNPKNVWVGTGESWTRNSVSIGNGIYQSTDGGETWTHTGLPDSERIAQDHRRARKTATPCYAAVPGALWSDSPDRGLYKTTDGGKNVESGSERRRTFRPAARRIAMDSDESEHAVRRSVGFSAQGLDVPLRRRRS